ncbi:uncharacterized protein LOC106663451 isoform X2 [Cimex lectularius]|uniref:Uncharacterized protein n=1 Tax=Cimex lectularius TaxID=79782 RepID=A0A8I6RCZ4_CIMLE|nr:uncharacterized protein LOC106663451 isoform X2 [Cimex lectularius]
MRVSFGSSKGSMVETLIYESPLQEEPELSPSGDQASVDSNQGSDSSKASKVRVTFFECEKPQVVSSPEPGELLDDLDVPVTMSAPITDIHAYQRQASTDSGWDNPFRPDGDLSREADEIVELIKGGKPITPTPVNGEAPKLPDVTQENGKLPSPVKATELNATPKGANGTKPLSNGDKAAPGQVELQRVTIVPPSDASQIEHVNLKKKPKCKCCVIQ